MTSQPLLLRNAIGEELRNRRLSQRRTLAQICSAAGISLGYLSEVERGRKEASSEILNTICDALNTPIEDIILAVGQRMQRNVPERARAIMSAVDRLPALKGTP